MNLELLLRPVAMLMNYRMHLLGMSGFLIAGAAVAYGVRTEDTVMALGALLFVPNAFVLLGVGLREHGWFDETSPTTPE
jgi:hypothetical protein